VRGMHTHSSTHGPLQIYACGDHYHSVGDALPDLKPLTLEATGKAYRRIGRFIQLALIGAARCAQSHRIPREAAVYFASGRGDLETTVEIMTQLFRDGQTPKPLAFVNTVSNAACFYVAQLLNLQSRSNFICNRYFAFENAVQLALLDLQCGIVSSALVGSVDIASAPLDDHRLRLQLDTGAVLGEASHWLWLGRRDDTRPQLGTIIAARHFAERRELLAWIEQRALSRSTCSLSAGQFIAADDFASLQRESGLTHTFEYREQRCYYDTQAGAVISAFLQSQNGQQHLLHVNANKSGQYSVLLVAR